MSTATSPVVQKVKETGAPLKKTNSRGVISASPNSPSNRKSFKDNESDDTLSVASRIRSASNHTDSSTDSFEELPDEESSLETHDDIDDDARIRSQSKSESNALKSKKEIDRSEWLIRLRKNNPDIAELKERISPVERTITFGEEYIPKRDEIQASISKQAVTQLILQHFQFEGLKNSRIQVESVARQKLSPSLVDLPESRLVNILRIAMKETERVWDLSMPDKYADEEELEEHLYEFGLLEEDLDSADDTNIWEEPDDDNIVWYTPPNSTKQAVKAASLNKLVALLTSEKDHDMEFQRIFLITYPSFTTPEKLLQKLMQRYQIPETLSGVSEQELKMMSTTIQPRVVNVFKKWLGDHWQDLNEQHMETFKSFLEKKIKFTSEKLYHQLQERIRRLKDGEEKKQLQFKEAPPDPKVDIKTIFSPTLSLFDIDEVEIARQMTIIEYELFSKIRPYELLNQAWNKPKLKHRAVNVLNLINRSTEMSSWVSTVIVREPKLKNRVKIFIRLIRIAEQLRKLNNFSTLMAIMAGLNNAAVFRMKITREEIPRQYQQIYEQLATQVNSQHGYKIYRETIANIQLPCIPFIGVYLTDLTFMDDGNANFLPSPKEGKDLINFAKRRMMHGVISTIQQMQQASYNLMPVYQILMLLKTEKLKSQKMEEKELWKLSLINEPKDADKASLE